MVWKADFMLHGKFCKFFIRRRCKVAQITRIIWNNFFVNKISIIYIKYCMYLWRIVIVRNMYSLMRLNYTKSLFAFKIISMKQNIKNTILCEFLFKELLLLNEFLLSKCPWRMLCRQHALHRRHASCLYISQLTAYVTSQDNKACYREWLQNNGYPYSIFLWKMNLAWNIF